MPKRFLIPVLFTLLVSMTLDSMRFDADRMAARACGLRVMRIEPMADAFGRLAVEYGQ